MPRRPYTLIKDYLNGVTIKELKQKYNINHIIDTLKETKRDIDWEHIRVAS